MSVELANEVIKIVEDLDASQLKLEKDAFDVINSSDTSLNLVKDGKVNRGAGKKILIAVIENDVEPEAYYKEQGMDNQGDSSVIEGVVRKVLDANPNAVKEYKEGKTKVVQFLFGMCMRELRGNGDPATINAVLTDLLNK